VYLPEKSATLLTLQTGPEALIFSTPPPGLEQCWPL